MGDIPRECRSLSQKSSLRIRFRLNQQTGSLTKQRTSQRALASFANIIIEEVGLQYSDQSYKQLRASINGPLRADIHKEIQHIARQYEKIIVGMPGKRLNRVTLTSARQDFSSRTGVGSPALQQFGALREYSTGGTLWAPRKPKYLVQKQRDVGHQRWFEHTGILGLAMSSGKTWEAMFGPIIIRIRRGETQTGNARDIKFNLSSGETRASDMKFLGTRSGKTFSVATIQVSALGKITAAMIPALLTGKPPIGKPADGRTTGLIGLVRAKNAPLAWHIAGGPEVPYRPTLEPFLGFALTRSIPEAVFARIRQSL